ncbi:MAG: glycoside hydrolase family 30 protein [Bdellovibrionota bacterium]
MNSPPCRRLAGIMKLAAIFIAATQPAARASSPARGAVSVTISSADQAHLLEERPSLQFSPSPPSGPDVLRIDTKIRYQEFLGFGAALTDGTATLLHQALSPEALHDLWVKLFDPGRGIGLSYLRLGIGASDLSPALYSYEDKPGAFSIEHDVSKAPVIPLVLEAMKLNPELRVMGSPWSPPAWMKSNHSMIQGELSPEHQQDFAEYLALTAQAWQKAGLKVDAITIQNEPKNDAEFTTSLFNLRPNDIARPFARVDEQTFVKEFLGPTFERAGLKTKILVWDHNYQQDGVDMIGEVQSLLGDSATRRYTGGAAFHCYSEGTVADLARIPAAYPGQDLYMSECSSGSWNSWNDEFDYDASSWIIGPLRAGAKVILKWGLALDDHHEPYLKDYAGSCSTCTGAVVIHNSRGGYNGKWSFERDYYILGQISRFVRPGAVRIDSNESADGVIRDVAFENPDHSVALYVYNSGTRERAFAVRTEFGNFAYSLGAHTAATFTF